MFALALAATVAAHEPSVANLRIVNEDGRGLPGVTLTLIHEEQRTPLGTTDYLGWSGLMLLPPHSAITAHRQDYAEGTVELEGGREELKLTLKKEEK